LSISIQNNKEKVDSSKNIEELLSEELEKGKETAFYLVNLSTLIMKSAFLLPSF